MQMAHSHLFRNHTPWAQRLIETRPCPPASQGLCISVLAIHEAQAVLIHPINGYLPPATPQRDRLGH